MSAGRRYRRTMQRSGAVELDHETRRLLGQVLRAHADDTVSPSEFAPLLADLERKVKGQRLPQRLEVAGRLIARSVGAEFAGWMR